MNFIKKLINGIALIFLLIIVLFLMRDKTCEGEDVPESCTIEVSE